MASKPYKIEMQRIKNCNQQTKYSMIMEAIKCQFKFIQGDDNL